MPSKICGPPMSSVVVRASFVLAHAIDGPRPGVPPSLDACYCRMVSPYVTVVLRIGPKGGAFLVLWGVDDTGQFWPHSCVLFRVFAPEDVCFDVQYYGFAIGWVTYGQRWVR